MADTGSWRRVDDAEQEDELDENDYKSQKDALLFAVDVSKSMLEPLSSEKGESDSAVSAALKCIYRVMQQRIISNPKDMMGILLFGTDKTKFLEEEGGGNNFAYPHTYVYVPLDVPGVEDVMKLKRLVEGDEDADAEGVLRPSTGEPVVIKDMLFCANQILTTKAPNFGSRRLFIITDNDDPHRGDRELKNQAATRAKDLYDLGTMIELFAITRGDRKFDLSKFYDDMIYLDPAYAATQQDHVTLAKSTDGLTLLNSLISNINSKQTAKRALFSNMKFELGPGLQISVKGYNVLQRQTPARSCYVWTGGETAQILKGETTHLAEDTTRTVEKVDVKKAYRFADQFVVFDTQELKEVKKFGDPILRIIGFKDRSLLKLWMAIKKSTFIFPSEDGFTGSTRVFAALWQTLIKSNKMGLAWHIARRNSNPVLVAVLPSTKPSAGLWLYPLPFADDIRDGPGTYSEIRTVDRLTSKMNSIVRELQLPGGIYDPARYPNPALQWHYKVIQAMALEEELPEKAEDTTIPKYKGINKRCGNVLEEWSDLADDVLSQARDQKAIKRDLEESGDDRPRPTKKSRKVPAHHPTQTGDGGTTPTDGDLKARHEAGGIAKMKVDDLKAVLAARGLDVRGLKAVLVARLEEYLESR